MRGDALGFVDDQQHLSVPASRLLQQRLEVTVEIRTGFEAASHAKGVQHQSIKIRDGEVGVRNQTGHHLFAQQVQQTVHHGGFSGAHVAGKQADAAATFDSLLQGQQGALILPPLPEKGRIGTRLKRCLPELVKLQVHAGSRLSPEAVFTA